MLTQEDLLFGKIAIDMNMLSPTQLERVKEELENSNLKIGELLVQKGYLYPWDIEEILAEQKKRKVQLQMQQTPAASLKPPELASPPPVDQTNSDPVCDVKTEIALTETTDTTKAVPSETPTNPSLEPINALQEPEGLKTMVPISEEQYSSSPPLIPIPVKGLLKELLTKARNGNASDLHLSVGSPPFFRKYKCIENLPYPALSAEDTEKIIFPIISESQKRYLLKNKSMDFCLTIPGEGRYRTCFYKQINGWDAVFRVIPNQVKSFDELDLPPAIKKLTEYPQGLILVTGPCGSGKTSTLAAMIDIINQNREDHIISIEDPVEYIQTPKKCQISQRELHSHTKSFANALKASLREDPDIIMIGEMRDRETMSLAISASETGHLVLGTMPTSSAARTINSVIDFFPVDQQAQIRSMISESLRGIISQNLIPKTDGSGVELAMEILVFDSAVSTIVRQNQIHQLSSVIQTGKARGMMAMDDSLMALIQKGTIDQEYAYALAENKAKFEPFKKRDRT